MFSAENCKDEVCSFYQTYYHRNRPIL